MYFRAAQEMWTPMEPPEASPSALASPADICARITAHEQQIARHTLEIQHLRRMLDELNASPRARLR
jgi:hypothetical protein